MLEFASFVKHHDECLNWTQHNKPSKPSRPFTLTARRELTAHALT